VRALGWSRERLACEFERLGTEWAVATPSRDALKKAIYRHETGRSEVIDELYRRLYCAALNATGQDLFGAVEFVNRGRTAPTFDVTSHKFTPVFVGTEAVRMFAAGSEAGSGRWADSWSREVPHSFGTCTAHAFAWGTLVFHLVEDLGLSSLAELALWRGNTHQREIAWAAKAAAELTNVGTDAAYVLSVFWMNEPIWDGGHLDTAMRLLCTPATLVPTQRATLERAQLVEERFLNDGYEADHLVNFGIHGTSIGYASWAGVSYFPLTQGHALQADSVVEFETVVQALWCYCDHLREHVAQGREPEVSPAFDWRGLRSIRARLVGARARESTQEARMRSAIINTSELAEHLDQTIVMLQDLEREVSR
jgi:hypothetical protein